MDETFIGTILLFAGNFAPQGWAYCDGRLLAISQNSALFSILDTTYGGDGVNTFALPDLCGRVPVGAGNGPGLSPRAIGQVGGTEAVTLLPNQLPAHTHPLLATDQLAANGLPAGAALATTDDAATLTPGASIYQSATPNTPLAAGSIGPAGGSQAHENMPPFLGLNYVICLQGIYPSRG